MSVMGIGPIELVVVLVIAYLVLGPERMTSTVRSLGKVVRDLREQTSGLPKTLDELLEPPEGDDTKVEEPEEQSLGVARPRRTRASQATEDDGQESSTDDPKSEE